MRMRQFQGAILFGLILLVLPLLVSAQGDIDVYLSKAEQAIEQGQRRRAVMYYTRIVRALPENTDHRARLGQIQLLRGKLEEARAQAQAILARDATHREGLILMSRVNLQSQAWEVAFGYLQILVQHYPDEPYAYRGLASVYSSRDDDAAAEAAMVRYRELQNKKAGDDGQ